MRERERDREEILKIDYLTNVKNFAYVVHMCVLGGGG